MRSKMLANYFVQYSEFFSNLQFNKDAFCGIPIAERQVHHECKHLIKFAYENNDYILNLKYSEYGEKYVCAIRVIIYSVAHFPELITFYLEIASSSSSIYIWMFHA